MDVAPDRTPLRILLTRHAESAANAGNILQGRTVNGPLSPEGHAQAKLLGKRLRAYEPAVVVSSPLRRARETALEVSRACGVPLVVRDELMEFSWGRYEGKPKSDELRSALVDLMERWDGGEAGAGLPGGETLHDAMDRLQHLIADASREHAGATVAAVGHGQINKVFLHLLTGEPFRRLNLLGQANGALNIVRVDLTQERQRALLVNDLAHLAARPPQDARGDVLGAV